LKDIEAAETFILRNVQINNNQVTTEHTGTWIGTIGSSDPSSQGQIACIMNIVANGNSITGTASIGSPDNSTWNMSGTENGVSVDDGVFTLVSSESNCATGGDFSGIFSGNEFSGSFVEVNPPAGCGPPESGTFTFTKQAPKIVFVTEATYTGDLGGIGGANAKCQAEADAAGLTGTYKAWLSDASTSPNDIFNKTGAPYTLVDGTTVVADDWSDLTDGTIDNAIDQTAAGVTLPPPGANAIPVWTGTETGGTTSYEHCDNWEYDDPLIYGTIGTTHMTDSNWTEAGTMTCSAASELGPARLFCFQQ
jgi:hypothetical protein